MLTFVLVHISLTWKIKLESWNLLVFALNFFLMFDNKSFEKKEG